MISISMLNFSFYLCIISLILLSCLCSCRLISFLKTVILNSLSGNSLGSVTGKLLSPFVVSCFLDFSCSLESCVAVFAFEGAITSSSLYCLALGGKYLQ